MTGDLSDADLARLAELDKAVLPPPWFPQPDDLIGGWCVTNVDKPPSQHGGRESGECSVADFCKQPDAALIAEARNALSALLAEVSAGRDAERRIARVRALHVAVRVPTVGGTEWTCDTCHPNGPPRYDESTWPCETIRALDGDGEGVPDATR